MAYCNEVRRYSGGQYRMLSRYFKYGLTVSELGRTDRFMLFMAECEHRHGEGLVEIYKTAPKAESRWGNDLDLWVQNPQGRYNRYALQAKVMSYNGAFRDLKVRRGAPRQQWEALLAHEQQYGSQAFYLLYSGRSRNPPPQRPTRADCMGIPTMSELGLGIVEAHVVADIRTNMLGPGQWFFFHYVFPAHVDSIRKLFCCANDGHENPRMFSRSEIDTSGYIRVEHIAKGEGRFERDLESEDSGELVELTDGRAPTIIIVHGGEAERR